MDSTRPTSRNRPRSILTTTSSPPVATIKNVCRDGVPKNRDRTGKSSINSKNVGRENRQKMDCDGYKLRDNTFVTPSSVFRSPSLEERLAKLGIDLSESGGGGSNWKHSLGGDSEDGGGDGSGRSRNSSSGQAGDGSDLSGRKSSRLSNDINKRISGISNSMDRYDKKVKNVQETMQTAYRNTVQDRKRLQKKQSVGSSSGSPACSRVVGGQNDSPESLSITTDDFIQKYRCSLKKDLFSEFDSVPSTNFVPLDPGAGEDDNNNNDVGHHAMSSSSGGTRNIFGLNTVAVLKSSSNESSSSSEQENRLDFSEDSEDTSDSSSTDEEGAATMKISIRHPVPSSGKTAKSVALKRFQENIKNQQHRSNNKDASVPGRQSRMVPKNKHKNNLEEFLPQRSLSPIKPCMPDKQFQTMLERREERVSRHLTSMQNELAQLNQRVEMDKRKASEARGKRGIMAHSYQGQPMRLMKSPPDKNLGNELNAFVQSSGGHAGSWERKDHNNFLKVFDVWRKHPNKLMEVLRKDLPHKKPQEIAAHIKWYERFEQLTSANRASVHQWSQEKRRESELIYQMGSASQRAKLEGDKRRQEHLRRIREQERDRGKEKLAQWKRTQAVRTANSSSASVSLQNHQAPQTPIHMASSSTSSTAFANNLHLYQLGTAQPVDADDTIEPSPQHRPATSTGTAAKPDSPVDIPGVRQHILDIAAKVHALDNPKRDFRPPRPDPVPGGEGRRHWSRPGPENLLDLEAASSVDPRKLTVSRSFNNLLVRPPTPPKLLLHHLPHPSQDTGVSAGPVTKPGGIRLPEIEPEVHRNRPTSSTSIRPPSSSLIHQQQQRNRRLIAEFRERDDRLVEAKKKAVEIARERRKSKINELTAADLKRRIRSRVNDGAPASSTYLNPTKQSDLRKTLTHLERLEMLSKQDLVATSGISGNSAHEAGDGNLSMMSSSLLMINNLPSKGIPSWRRPSGGSGDYF